MSQIGNIYNEGKRYTRMYRALYQPILVMGGERDLVLFSGLICGGTAINSLTWLNIVVSVILWTLAIAALRAMAKSDPQMSKIYVRSLRYAAFYPAVARPEARAK